MTLLTRRSFAAGAATLAVLPATPVLANTAARTFRVMRGDQSIGTHTVSVQRLADGGKLATSNIDIAVKGLGIITLYSYTLSCTETYDAQGNLISMDGQCNDNGKPHFVKVDRDGDTLLVSGSSYNGSTPAASTGAASYWFKDNLSASPWISTQSGELLAVSTAPISSAEAPAGATAYRVTNNADYTIDVFYDARGEWIGSAFDAKGERATMLYQSETGALRG